MKLLEFRTINLDDPCDPNSWGHQWSRIYEYPTVLSMIERYAPQSKTVHNTSWGFEGCHVEFKQKLDQSFQALHTDIRASQLPNTDVWDLLTHPRPEWLNAFDVVINISTLEEMRGTDHYSIFARLVDQAVDGGLVIVTFDLPGLQIQSFERRLEQKFVEHRNRMTSRNSARSNDRWDLHCGILVVQK